jgi:hypothetical protein
MRFDDLDWKDTQVLVIRPRSCKYIYIDRENNKIYKKYRRDTHLPQLYETYKLIKDFDFVPKMEFYFEEKVIIEDFYNTPLNCWNKPKDYRQQLDRIHRTLRRNNLYHNDYTLNNYFFFINNKNSHFFVKQGKIKLIDYGGLTQYKPKPPYFNNINRIKLQCTISLPYLLFYILILIFLTICLLVRRRLKS